MTRPVGFGVLGANSFVANAAVLPAIEAAPNARLVAAASRSGPVPSRWGDAAVDDYESVLEHPDVEAVYLPLPNGLHRKWTERCAAAGKHVLCEKPLAAAPSDARAMADACAAAGVLLAEAWMTPFDHRWRRAIEAARTHEFGTVVEQQHRFTFTIAPTADDNYRWDPAQGGGALLDVGIYTVWTAAEIWGTDCTIDRVERITTERGVDADTIAHLSWAGRGSATIHCSFVDDEVQRAEFVTATGRITLPEVAFTSGGSGGDQVRVTTSAGDVHDLTVTPGLPYASMVDAFADAVRGIREWPRSVGRSIELLELLHRIARTEASAP